ncbi:STAS domain-containing protein [bacterium]|nr:STAS domain-containing protein [bacterium]
MESLLDTLEPQQHPVKILDLQNLVYISSAGLRCFLQARKRLRVNGGQMLLLHVQPAVKRILDITKAFSPEELFSSLFELEQCLNGIPKQI